MRRARETERSGSEAAEDFRGEDGAGWHTSGSPLMKSGVEDSAGKEESGSVGSGFGFFDVVGAVAVGEAVFEASGLKEEGATWKVFVPGLPWKPRLTIGGALTFKLE
jgi:hypothetical protein